jgi:malonyl-CoA O-methyltransferase
MAERLGFVRMQPDTILDAGCGTGAALGELHSRYPDARLVGLDLAFNMTLAARDRSAAAAKSARSLLGRVLGSLAPERDLRAWCICGDIVSLPIKAASIDLIWSNLTLQWVGDPQKAFAEFRRALRVGGLLSFTTFGPDTLKELRTAFLAADRATHVGRFIDMHDIGDMLVHAGFADPVMDMETLTLTYGDAIDLMRDLKAIGAHNVTAGRPRGLMGRQGWQRMLAALEATRRDGRLPASFEVVYGHAWKAEPRVTDDGSAIIRVEPRSRQ